LARITLGFDDFGWEALSLTARRHGLSLGELVGAACRRRLARCRQAVAPPLFQRDRIGLRHDVTIDLEPAELRGLESDAELEHVELGVVIRHAVFTLLAEIESGRLVRELGADDEASAHSAG
jgi:hypothetical protein